MGERIFSDNGDGWRAKVNVPDFSDMPASGVTDDAGERFVMPAVQDMSEAPSSAAVEGGVHLVSPENNPDTHKEE